MTAALYAPTLPARKHGAAADRAECARWLREQRALYASDASVQESWARRDWMNLLLSRASNDLERLTRRRRSLSVIAGGAADARAAARSYPVWPACAPSYSPNEVFDTRSKEYAAGLAKQQSYIEQTRGGL